MWHCGIIAVLSQVGQSISVQEALNHEVPFRHTIHHPTHVAHGGM